MKAVSDNKKYNKKRCQKVFDPSSSSMFKSQCFFLWKFSLIPKNVKFYYVCHIERKETGKKIFDKKKTKDVKKKKEEEEVEQKK